MEKVCWHKNMLERELKQNASLARIIWGPRNLVRNIFWATLPWILKHLVQINMLFPLSQNSTLPTIERGPFRSLRSCSEINLRTYEWDIFQTNDTKKLLVDGFFSKLQSGSTIFRCCFNLVYNALKNLLSGLSVLFKESTKTSSLCNRLLLFLWISYSQLF